MTKVDEFDPDLLLRVFEDMKPQPPDPFQVLKVLKPGPDPGSGLNELELYLGDMSPIEMAEHALNDPGVEWEPHEAEFLTYVAGGGEYDWHQLLELLEAYLHGEKKEKPVKVAPSKVRDDEDTIEEIPPAGLPEPPILDVLLPDKLESGIDPLWFEKPRKK